MVRIRYATRTIIQEALDATSAKFDNNIKFNRFDAVDSYYEVTLKCKSSRGEGAKVSREGRHLISCCWHVWGTFFDELLRLNPNIVIIAMGHRIDANGGNWEDVNGESQLCECGNDAHTAWIEEQNRVSQAIQDADEGEIDRMIAARAHDELIEERNELSRQLQREESESDVRCRGCGYDIHNHCEYDVAVGGSRPLTCPNLRAAIPTIVTPPNRTCSTCMYSSQNASDGTSQCPPGRCLRVEGLQNWMPVTCDTCQYFEAHRCILALRPDIALIPIGCPSALGIREKYKQAVREKRCHLCKYACDRTGKECTAIIGACLTGNPKWVLYSDPAPIIKSCTNCEHNYDKDGNVQSCLAAAGVCNRKSKWELYQPFVYKGTPTSRYNTQMVERDEQIEQIVEFPMLKEE